MRLRLQPILFIASVACSGKAAPAPEPPAAASSEPAKPAASAPAAPAMPPASNDAVRAGGLTWAAGTPFRQRPPKSSMRVAEYGVDGDESAELAVFYFGADQGGSIENNMSRWIAQFKQPDGSQTQAKRSERSVNGMNVALVEASGTYSGGMAMPGMPSRGEQANAGLLGAIAQGPSGGPVFFKLVGSRGGIDQARPGFDALISSIHSANAN
jgi:hypothetical protein